MKALLTIVLGAALSIPDTRAQRIAFTPVVRDVPLVLDKPFVLGDQGPVTITQFKFYVGQFTFYRAGKPLVYDHSYYLIDAADTTTFDVGTVFRPTPIDSVSFLLGVDSLTNVSGVFGGDLDPIKGMYWTWNSGYINLKLEGTSPRSPYATHAFELHLGGYLPPFPTVQRVTLPLHGLGPWHFGVDVVPLLESADVSTRCNVMSPGEQALRLSKASVTMFKSDALR